MGRPRSLRVPRRWRRWGHLVHGMGMLWVSLYVCLFVLIPRFSTGVCACVSEPYCLDRRHVRISVHLGIRANCQQRGSDCPAASAVLRLQQKGAQLRHCVLFAA